MSAERCFQSELDDEGILIVTLDVPGKKVNTLGRGMAAELAALIGDIEFRADVRGAVLRSGKPDNFIAGADIEDFLAIHSARQGEELAQGAQALLGKLAALAKPVVAAIHGACLGGGLETALACRYRVASDHEKTVLGQPEVKLGLIPGAGGTQRLPRLVGLAAALDAILTGRSIRPERALRIGLVDEVAPHARLTAAACAAAVDLVEQRRRPRRGGLGLGERLARPLIFRKARARVEQQAGGHYPAPLRALDVVQRGTAGGLERGLALEAQAFGELSVSSVSRALVSVFFATQEIRKDTGVPDDVEPREVRKLGVIGAGLMGAGIAAAGAEAGVAVRLKDVDDQALSSGLRYARGVFDERRRRGRLTRRELEQRMDRISATVAMTGLRQAQLVIEAVFEDLGLKRAVLAEIEAATRDDCVVGSNTSSLPIGQIADGARRPERVLGMHFFSPVHRMPLLEVVVTDDTDAFATATAVSFGRRLGKNVIVVRDGPGFFTTRALAPYLNEAVRLLGEGARVEELDRALTAFGFPVGPLALLDEVGIDVAAKVSKILYDHLGERMTPPAQMEKVIADGRLGRKSGRGFYDYSRREKRPDESLYALLPETERRTVDPREAQDRLGFAFLNEAVYCLQDGVLRTPRDGDVGAIFGLGYPPFLGGPFRYLDQLGARYAVDVLERLERRHGERFRPAPLLVERARSGQPFFA